jgi:hypothetical protein
MTKRDKIGWALAAPFLTALAGGIILTIYIAITEAPIPTLAVAVILAGVAGVCVLESDASY